MSRPREFAAVLLVLLSWLATGSGTARAAAPEISYVPEPMRHYLPFLVFGEGLDQPQTELVRWSPATNDPAEKLIAEIAQHGLPAPPATPPANSTTAFYGPTSRPKLLSPQVWSGIGAGVAAVLWARSPAGLSAPYVVNRPQPYFVEFETLAPGQRARLFGRNLQTPWLKNSLWLVSRPEGKVYPLPVGTRYNYQNSYVYQREYEVTFVVPPDTPVGSYDLWVHNGSNGAFGFGGPLPVQIQVPSAKPKPVFAVAAYGAKGDGVTDDTGAIQQAIMAAEAAGGGVVQFGLGRYALSYPLRVPPGVDLDGQDREWAHLTALPGFKGQFPSAKLPGSVEDFGPYFRAMQAAPMVYLLANSRVSNLTVEGNDATQWCLLATNEKGAHDITVTRCRLINPSAPVIVDKWLPSGSAFAIIGASERVELSDCELRALAGTGCLGSARHCRMLNNTYEPLEGRYGTTGMGWILGTDCLVENNTRNGSNRGFTCGLWMGPIAHNYIARNAVTNGGFADGAGESYLFEGPQAGRENWIGHPTETGPDFFAEQEQKLPAHGLQGRIVMIAHGKGFGQFRIVRDNDEHQVWLTEPWRVEPDETSWVSVRPMFFENLLISDNCRDAVGGIDFYGAALNNVVAGYSAQRSRGVWFYGDNSGDVKTRLLYGPVAFNQVQDCTFLEDAAVAFESCRQLNTLQPVPLVFGNQVYSCRFLRSGVTSEDQLLDPGSPKGLHVPAGDPRREGLPPSLAYNTLGGNTFDERTGRPSFQFVPEMFGTVLWSNNFGKSPTPATELGQGTVSF